jgi:hypothetical protein
MYTHSMNLRILRNMAGGEGGAAAGAAAGAAQGGAGEGAAAGGEGSQQAPQYLTKADLESFSGSFRSEIAQQLSRLNRPEPKAKAEKQGSDEPNHPDPSKYDFKGDPQALTRYNEDLRKYFRAQDKREAAAEAAEAAKAEAPRKAFKEHKTRLDAYKKDHPEFEEDRKKAGAIQAMPEVSTAVYASKASPAILHYLIKNSDVVEELNEMAHDGDAGGIRERLGEISATIRAESKRVEAEAAAAKDRPPRQNFRGPSGPANRKASLEERFARHNAK